MRRGLVSGIALVVALAVVASAFVIDVTEQAVVLQLGEPVRVITEPGLYFRVPLLQTVARFDKRVQYYDFPKTEIITRDKKSLVVDNYALWRIADPQLFLETVRNEAGAQARLDDIVYSELRVELGRNDFEEIISRRRSEIMSAVTAEVDGKTRSLGIAVLDVRIKRADLPPENAQSVYERMRAERERIAKQYRSEGEEEAMKIRAQADKEQTIILANAQMEAERIRGEGDAEAARIYAESYSKDPEFYSFQRSLEGYKNALPPGTELLLGTGSRFLRHLSE